MEFIPLIEEWVDLNSKNNSSMPEGAATDLDDPALETIKRDLLGIIDDDEPNKVSRDELLERAEDLLLFSPVAIPKRRYVCDSAYR